MCHVQIGSCHAIFFACVAALRSSGGATPDDLISWPARLAAVTPAAVERAAQRYFSDASLRVVAVGDLRWLKHLNDLGLGDYQLRDGFAEVAPWKRLPIGWRCPPPGVDPGASRPIRPVNPGAGCRDHPDPPSEGPRIGFEPTSPASGGRSEWFRTNREALRGGRGLVLNRKTTLRRQTQEVPGESCARG